MTQTFVFEELDDHTREYLTDVRDAAGEGAPGIFVPTSSSLAGCGCILGPIVIGFTLVATLTTWPADLVYQEPGAIALLQTAGLLAGGWLLFAGLRLQASKMGNAKIAGNWVYADALHLYNANQEQVSVTRIDDVVEANFTHNYNNGAYQNSVVRVVRSGEANTAITFAGEVRAEQLATFLNYLAWARSENGGDRASFPPAQLGAVAKYVALNDVEPKNVDDTIDMDLVDLQIAAVPEEPTREGRAAPNILPYIVMLVASVAIFVLMWKVVNPPLRDDAMYKAVMEPDQCVEPLSLRAYLIDERNHRHRTEVTKRLERIYSDTIARVKGAGTDPTLREGFAKVLDSVKGPDQPTVSLRVTEEQPKPGAQKRVETFKDELVGKIEPKRVNPSSKEPDYFEATGGIYAELARIMPPVNPPTPRTAVGIQLIEFANKPEDAAHAHFEISYEFVPVKNNLYQLSVKVEFRTKLDGPPDVTYEDTLPGQFSESEFDSRLKVLNNKLLTGMVGPGGGGGMFKPQPPQFPIMPGQ